MNASEIEVLLQLVDYSAERLLPEEELDFLDDYKNDVRARGALPPSVKLPVDHTAAHAIETSILLAAGLTFLGQIGSETIKELVKKAVDSGFDSVSHMVSQWHTARASGKAEGLVVTQKEIADAVLTQVNRPAGVSDTEARRIIQVQLELVESNPEMTATLRSP